MKILKLLVLMLLVSCAAKQSVEKAEQVSTIDSEVNAFLTNGKKDFQKCGAKLKKGSSITLQFVIAKNGKVSAVSVIENSTGNLDVPECLTLKVNKLAVKSKPTEDTVFKHKFEF